MASEVEIAPPVEADLPQLFGLAKGTFAGMPGWSDERALEVLKRDLIFVAREEGEAAGYVALRREETGRSWSSSCSSRPATSGVASDTGCSLTQRAMRSRRYRAFAATCGVDEPPGLRPPHRSLI